MEQAPLEPKNAAGWLTVARALLLVHVAAWSVALVLVTCVSGIALMLSEPLPEGSRSTLWSDLAAIAPGICLPAFLAASALLLARRLGAGRRWKWLSAQVTHLALAALYAWFAAYLLRGPGPNGIMLAGPFLLALLIPASLCGAGVLLSPAMLRYAGVLGRRSRQAP